MPCKYCENSHSAFDPCQESIDAMSDKSKGLYHKFNVIRTDGKDSDGGKHVGCDYFVLDLTHDPHALPALKAYADSCAIDSAEMPEYPRDWNRYMNTSRHADWIEQYVEKLRTFAQAQSARADENAMDADRHRWLRQQNIVPYPSDFNPGGLQNIIVFWDSADDLDAAIDAAIAAGKGEANAK